jgi:hypothetical protein
MSDPAQLDWAPNWFGGFYELSIELKPRNDERLAKALLAIWQVAGVAGCYAPSPAASVEPNHVSHLPVALGPGSLADHGHLRGVVGLPSGVQVVCGAVAIRLDEGVDWLAFYVPLGALVEIDRRIGGFPFGDDAGPESLEWRHPLDAWLADMGMRLASEVPFDLALIGFETYAAPEDFVARLVRDDGVLRYLPAKR